MKSIAHGTTAALEGRQVSAFARSCLSIEMLVAAQALKFRLPVKLGNVMLAAYEKVLHMEKDREPRKDI